MDSTTIALHNAPSNLEGIDELIQQALQEDVGPGDITTNRIISPYQQSQAIWKAKEEGAVAGLFVGKAVFKALDENIQWKPQVEEGTFVQSGDILVKIEGASRTILTAERIALNFVQRISGIATNTYSYAKLLEGTKTQVLDTRKTLPGYRTLDKYAVKVGGGKNHRMGLYDMALVKENHIAVAGGITQAVKQVSQGKPTVSIEVETTNLSEVKEAISAGADIIMLDNMSNAEMEQAVRWIAGRAKTEASGNVTLERIKEIAATGVDYISVGALTHSVKAFDISQLILS